MILNDDSNKTKFITVRLGLFSSNDSFTSVKSISANALHLGNNIYFSHFEFNLSDVNMPIGTSSGVAAVNISEFNILSVSGFLRVGSLHGNGVQFQMYNHYIFIRKEDGQAPNQSIVGDSQYDILTLGVILG